MNIRRDNLVHQDTIEKLRKYILNTTLITRTGRYCALLAAIRFLIRANNADGVPV